MSDAPTVNIICRMPVPRFGVPGFKPRYPFDGLKVGEAFLVPYQRAGLENLKTACRKRNRKPGGRVFRPVMLADGNGAIERVE